MKTYCIIFDFCHGIATADWYVNAYSHSQALLAFHHEVWKPGFNIISCKPCH